ncbi:MAG: glycine cleavage system protein GcvH, partial [Planctomycetota bacterium]
MAMPTDRKYSETHEWFKLEGDTVTVGLTQFAVDQLTDVTFVEMKEAGTDVDAGDSVGEVESVKTTSDVYSVVGGTVAETNDAASDDPAILNSDPYEAGWLIKITVGDASQLDGLMDAAA